MLILIPLNACYSLEQAYWFNNAYNSRVGVDDLLLQIEPEMEEPLKKKLLLSREVLAFAKMQGLNAGESYRHFIPERSAQVSFLVQASRADKFEAKTWWFPVVGRVPYLGFFDRSKRDAEAELLRNQGYDVSLGSVGAFSSLGWFDDPIYASMTKRSDHDFVQLLFHELVHRSYWSQGSAAFNENLAEFLGLKLARMFLSQAKNGQGVRELEADSVDQELFRKWLQSLKQALEELYNDEKIEREQKLKLKADIIQQFTAEKYPKMQTEVYAGLRKRQWNNASILGAALYSPDTEKFSRSFACAGEPKIGEFLARIRAVEDDGLKADQALESLCTTERKAENGRS